MKQLISNKDGLPVFAHVVVGLATVAGALNTAQLLAEFQPGNLKVIGWFSAAVIAAALFICVEAFIKYRHWLAGVGVAVFGGTEVLGQIGHAAYVNQDAVVLTPGLEWALGYISPSVVVIAAVLMAFVIRYAMPHEDDQVDPLAPLYGRIEAMQQQLTELPSPAEPFDLERVINAAAQVDDPSLYVVDPTTQRIKQKQKIEIPPSLNGSRQ